MINNTKIEDLQRINKNFRKKKTMMVYLGVWLMNNRFMIIKMKMNLKWIHKF